MTQQPAANDLWNHHVPRASVRFLLRIPACFLIVVLCYLMAFAWVNSGSYTPVTLPQGFGPAYDECLFTIGNLEDEPSTWWVHDPPADSQIASTATVSMRYRITNLNPTRYFRFFDTPARRRVSYEIEGFTTVSPSDPTFEEAMQREFGSDWMSLEDIRLRTVLLPGLQERLLEREIALRRSEDRYTVVTELTGGVLVIARRDSVWRWRIWRQLIGWSGVLWSLVTLLSIIRWKNRRELREYRWLAGQCAKCAYPRSSTRDDCAECGLQYERPSHVTWDPKDGKVEV